MANDTDWTEDGIVRLRALWADGHPTAEIGRRLCISKNAIIGKAHRLDLPPRPSPIHAKGSGKPRRPRMPRACGPDLPSLDAVADSMPRTRVPPPTPAKPAVPAFVRIRPRGIRAAGPLANRARSASDTATQLPSPESPTAPSTRVWPTSRRGAHATVRTAQALTVTSSAN